MASMAETTLDTILARRNLTKDDLNFKCSDKQLNKLALKIDDWQSLAHYIGLTQQDVESIKDNNRRNLQKKQAMLRKFSTTFHDDATYFKLAEAFELLKRRDLIGEIIDLALAQIEEDKVKATSPGSRDNSSNRLQQLVAKGSSQSIRSLNSAQRQKQQKDNNDGDLDEEFDFEDSEEINADENGAVAIMTGNLLHLLDDVPSNKDPQNEQQQNPLEDLIFFHGNEQPPLVPNPDTDQQQNVEQGGAAARVQENHPMGGPDQELPMFTESKKITYKVKAIQNAESVSKLRKDIKLILHTCNDREQQAIMQALGPLSLENESIVVWDPEGHAYIGLFAQHTVAVLFTRQANKARSGLQCALKMYEKAEGIIGVGIGYGKDRKSFLLGDVMVSNQIENAASVKIEESEDVPLKVSQRGDRQEVNRELVTPFTNHKFLWKDNFQVTQSKEGQADRFSQVHVGTVVSGTILLKNKALKEHFMALMDKSVGGEMEGWVLLELKEEMRLINRQISVIVVKGVADYGDIDKDNGWQLTAAMAAVDLVRHCIETNGKHAKYVPAT